VIEYSGKIVLMEAMLFREALDDGALRKGIRQVAVCDNSSLLDMFALVGWKAAENKELG